VSTTRVQHRPWRNYSPYAVEIRRWKFFVISHWEPVDSYRTYEEAFMHASQLAHDGETKKIFSGHSSWTP
jgi:hypothetical protein